MKIQIVCRGSQKEGLGHLFRTKTFAGTAMADHDVEVVAIVDEPLEPVLAALGDRARFVRSACEVPEAVEVFRPDVLLYDLTTIDPAVFDRIFSIPILTASLSPIFDQMSRVDIMFSRGSTPPALDGVKVVSGLEYAIFSEQCVKIEDVYYERTLELSTLPIAVCMGGTDAANKTQRLIQELVGTASPYTIWVLLGEGYAHSYQALVDTVRADTRHEVILAKTNQSMWRVMANCALAILTGGLTTLEAVYAGLPTINLFEKEEHSRMMQGLFDLAGCLNGGIFSDSSMRKMTETLESLSNDRDRLREMRKKTQGLLDKEGSKRVLRKLEMAVLEKAVARSKEAGDKP